MVFVVAVSQNGPRNTEQQLQTISDAFLDARVFKLVTVEKDPSPARKIPLRAARHRNRNHGGNVISNSRAAVHFRHRFSRDSTIHRLSRDKATKSVHPCVSLPSTPQVVEDRWHQKSHNLVKKKKTRGTSPDWKSNVEAHTDPRLRTLHCAVRHMGVCEHTQLHSRHAVSIDFFRSLRPPFVHQFLGRSAVRCAKECSHTHSHIAWQRF